MDDMRKAFEARFPEPEGVEWNGREYKAVRACCWEELIEYRGKWQAWQAATLAERERQYNDAIRQGMAALNRASVVRGESN